MKAEAMSAAISQESPVSPGFQLKEDDVQKIEGVMTGGAQSLMKIAPQVENAVRSFKLFTNQMFSGLQKFYRAAPQPQASVDDIAFADIGVMPDTAKLSQESRVQLATNSNRHRGVTTVFTHVGRQIGELLKQPPVVLAQQLGLSRHPVSEMAPGLEQFAASHAVTQDNLILDRAVDIANAPNTLSQPHSGHSPQVSAIYAPISDRVSVSGQQLINSSPKHDAAVGDIDKLTQQVFGDSMRTNMPHSQVPGAVKALNQQVRDIIPQVDAAIAPVAGYIDKLTQQVLGDSPKANATDSQAVGAVKALNQQVRDIIPQVDAAIAPVAGYVDGLTQQAHDTIPKVDAAMVPVAGYIDRLTQQAPGDSPEANVPHSQAAGAVNELTQQIYDAIPKANAAMAPVAGYIDRLTQQVTGSLPKADVPHSQATGAVKALNQQVYGAIPKANTAMAPVAGYIDRLTQQILGDSPKANATNSQAIGAVNVLTQQAHDTIPKVGAAMLPITGYIDRLTQQILGDSPKTNTMDSQATGAVKGLSQQILADVAKNGAVIGQASDSAATFALRDKQPTKKGVMPSLAGVMQNENVKILTDSLDYVKGKYGGGFVETMRKLMKNPFLKPQNVIAGSRANQAEDPKASSPDVLSTLGAEPIAFASIVEPVSSANPSMAAIPVARGIQGLDSLAQKLLVNLQPGVNSLNQLVNQWPVGDSKQAMEQVWAISKSLQIEPNAIFNLSNPGVVSELMGGLTVQDTRHYPYAQGASLTLPQPASASHNLNQTTTINVYGAAEPQVTANEIEARQTNIHSRLSQQLSGGPR